MGTLRNQQPALLERVNVSQGTDELTKTRQKRKVFFELLFPRDRVNGFMCIAFIDRQNKNKFLEQFFKYPAELEDILTVIEDNVDKDVYFCTQLFAEPRRKKYTVSYAPCVWADLDECIPSYLRIQPTFVIQSSPGRYQAYWSLDKNYDTDDVENIAKRIAYAHEDQGADRSGWDLTQLLRVPFTPNYKYKEEPQVVPIGANNVIWSLTAFDDVYENVDAHKRIEVPPFDIDRSISAQELLDANSGRMNPLVWTLFNETPKEDSWSEVLWKLLLVLFESGLNRERVFIVAAEAKCNKYARDGRPALQLWKDVIRAETKYMAKTTQAFSSRNDLATFRVDLMSNQERKRAEELQPSFVERYITWASSTTDAAKQYHQAGALVALSSVLCGGVRLPSSYGTIVPNLWFGILADTTLTRKTTAMSLCTDIVEEVNEDAIMGTDGSIEGMLTMLSQKANQPSIFFRDEFSGLIEQMNKKEYMSGMAELLTNLYDGKLQKRVLRKEIIEVRNPRLIMFVGGIRDAITGSLTFENVASGFIPRFIFITAESDIKKVRPVGPPKEEDQVSRRRIVVELMKLHEYYGADEEVLVPNSDYTLKRKKFFDVKLTDETWQRYNKLEADMMSWGLSHSRQDIMTPVCARLAMSILKTAILIGTSKSLSQNPTVELDDLLRAISYGETWFTHTRAVVERIGIGASERKLQLITKAIAQTGAKGMHRMEIMKVFRMTKREYDQAFETLEARGEIFRNKVSRGEVVTAVQYGE